MVFWICFPKGKSVEKVYMEVDRSEVASPWVHRGPEGSATREDFGMGPDSRHDEFWWSVGARRG